MKEEVIVTNKRKGKIPYNLWLTKEEETNLINALEIAKDTKYKKLENKIGEFIVNLYKNKELERR